MYLKAKEFMSAMFGPRMCPAVELGSHFSVGNPRVF